MQTATATFLMCVVFTGATPGLDENVRGAMRANRAALDALQPLLIRPSTLEAPENAEAVRKSLEAFAGLRHVFLAPGAPTAAAVTSTLFSEALARAEADLAAKRFDAAARRLRGLTTFCSECHSRRLGEHEQGPLALPPPDAFSAFERGQFFAATRQFDAALSQWRVLMGRQPGNDADEFERRRAFDASLVLLVRVKDDASRVIELLNARRSEPLSATEKKTLDQMLVETRAWAKERFDVTKHPSAALVEKARALLVAAKVEEPAVPSERSRVAVLRASAALSLAIEKTPSAPWRGEALYLLGLSTSSAIDPMVWELDGLFFEACVRENPHSAIASKCVAKLRQRLELGFSGSGGLRLPADVVKRLDTLEAIAR